MWGKRRVSAALLASAAACVPLSAAAARSASAQLKPGSVFVGAPKGFGSDKMHWLVSNNGKAMMLQGWFAWSYGCSRPLHNYGIADARTLGQAHHGSIPLYGAPAVVIRGARFSGSAELQKQGHKYGRFTIWGRFTGARTARATFSFANPPHCGTLTFHFTLHAA